MNSTFQKVTITVVIAGFPKNLKMPKPLPGETMLQCVIRNHQMEWQNCVEYMEHHSGLPAAFRSRFLHAKFEREDGRWSKEIEEFMNFRLPSHGRTLKCLAELRDGLDAGSIYRLAEILVPREKNLNPSVDEQVSKISKEYGARLIWQENGTATAFSLGEFLSQTQGDLIWLVHGGTRFMSTITALGLGRVVEMFLNKPRLALYYDGLYTMIYRAQALREVMARGESWPHELGEQRMLLQRCGYEALGHKMPLVNLEPIYGGESGLPDEALEVFRSMTEPRPWWRRLLGL